MLLGEESSQMGECVGTLLRGGISPCRFSSSPISLLVEVAGAEQYRGAARAAVCEEPCSWAPFLSEPRAVLVKRCPVAAASRSRNVILVFIALPGQVVGCQWALPLAELSQ